MKVRHRGTSAALRKSSSSWQKPGKSLAPYLMSDAGLRERAVSCKSRTYSLWNRFEPHRDQKRTEQSGAAQAKRQLSSLGRIGAASVSYTHLRAHETDS